MNHSQMTPESMHPKLPFTPASSYEAKVESNLHGLDLAAQNHGLTSRALYVVWNEEAFSVLHDPMTNRPVSARNKKLLEEVAKAFKGTIITAAEATAKLMKGRK